MTKAIIIGGTGMLAKAVREMAHAYDEVILIARHPEKLAGEIGARYFAMDWGQKDTVMKVLDLLVEERGKIDCLLTWLHKDGVWCLPAFEALLAAEGRSLRVHGSAAGDPAEGITTDPPPPLASIRRQNIVLGWVPEKTGRRWLCNDEISDGVLHAWRAADLPHFVVGTVGAKTR